MKLPIPHITFFIATIFMVSSLITCSHAGTKTPSEKTIFPSQVAGSFYPAQPQQLQTMLKKYMDIASLPSPTQKPWGIIVPHAGYPYSGPVAAHAYTLVKKYSYDHVIILGPAHRYHYRIPAVLNYSHYQTPLGNIALDQQGIHELIKAGVVQVDESKFRHEHALEVQLPFLQRSIASFTLLPIMISDPNPKVLSTLAQALLPIIKRSNSLVVASTDLSHDFSYQVAQALDNYAIELVTSLDSQALIQAQQDFYRYRQSLHLENSVKLNHPCTQMCGLGPVLTIMKIANLLEHPSQVTLLDMRNSGDIVDDKNSRIVGYAALSFSQKELGFHVTKRQQTALLAWARTSLSAKLQGEALPQFTLQDTIYQQPAAAFVTLKKHDHLRGCIGHMEPSAPMWQMIQDRAIDAALHDSRFPPVSSQELDAIQIEISLLTPRKTITKPLEEIIIGKHGVWLEHGGYRGVFLPQVPVEQHWSTVEQYLTHLCRKAHIFDPSCWKHKDTTLQTFEALVFGE